MLRKGFALALLGVAVGLSVSWGVAARVEPLLFQVQGRDVSTYVAVAALLASSALLAPVLPARRSACVDLQAVLKSE